MLVFLSHSGSDSDAAKTLKDRIEASPLAKERRLKIWLDIDELRPGDEWQPALEAALEKADAFMVYVGSGGVVNWVDRELRHAMTRATGPGAIPFIPVLSHADLDETILPPFVQQFQAVTDPLGDAEALSRLVASLVDSTLPTVAVTDRPFVGLAPMSEAEADRFFGRDAEIEQLSDIMRRQSLVAVVADSGAGKSSLVRAGLVPAFRGGALVNDAALRTAKPRHVVIMRPGADPMQGLRDGVDKAARGLGKDAGTRRSLRQSISASDPGETFYALACDIDDDQPDILLVVDQFEELLTATSPQDAAAFVTLLLALVDNQSKPIRCVLTVRVDYFNLIRSNEALFARLTKDGGAAQLRLKRVSDAALDDIVKRPLIMAGHTDSAEQDALSAAIRRDITDRPGDLALVQMALYGTWQRHVESGSDLMTAYAEVNGVLGALAHKAEETRITLDTSQQEALLALFVRLVRLGDTGGATRRIAALSDLDAGRAELAQLLASEQAGRLLMVGEETVEISHEALVAQWPWLQAHIQENADQIRTLAKLGDRTQTWKMGGAASLPNESERRAFEALAGTHADWLSEDERACLKAASRKALIGRVTRIAAMLAIVVSGAIAGVMAVRAINAEAEAVAALVDANEATELALERQKQLRDQSLVLQEETMRADEAAQDALWEAEDARKARDAAARNAAGGLAALSTIAADQKRWSHAIALALAAWPRTPGGGGVQLPDPVVTLSQALPAVAFSQANAVANPSSARAAISVDGAFYAFQKDNRAPLALYNVNDPEPILTHKTYNLGSNFAFSPDGQLFAASAQAPFAILKNLRKPGKPMRMSARSSSTTAVAFSPDSQRVYVAIEGGRVLVFDTDAQPIRILRPARSSHIWALAAHPDGRHLFVGDRNGRLTMWDMQEDQAVYSKQIGQAPLRIENIELSADGSLLAVHYSQNRRPAHLFFEARTGALLCCVSPDDRIVLQSAINESAIVSRAGQTQITISGRALSIKSISVFADNPSFGAGQRGPLIALSADGMRRFEASASGRLLVRDLQSDLILSEYDDRFGPILAMRALSDTALFIVNPAGQSRVLDLTQTPDLAWRLPQHKPSDQIWTSQDGRHFVTRRGDAALEVWRLSDAKHLATVPGVQPQSPVSISNDGQTLAAKLDSGTPAAFDLRGGPDLSPPIIPLEQSDRFSGSVGQLSPNGRWMASADNARTEGYVSVTDTKTGKLVLKEEFKTNGNLSIRFPDTGDFFWAGGQRFDLTDAATTEALDADPFAPTAIDVFIENLATGAPTFRHAALTLDKTRLAIALKDGISVLDTATGVTLANLAETGGEVLALDFPSPQTLRALIEDGRIGTWNLSHIAQGNAFEVACRHYSDTALEEALRGFPIIVAEPICDQAYAPQIPEWMEAAHNAIKLPRPLGR